MLPSLVNGNIFSDQRGKLLFNNSFDLSQVKRVYVIKNDSTTARRWQGHKVEQRWFSAMNGIFEIELIKVDDWKKPNKNLKTKTFKLSDKKLDFLHIPSGYISSIKPLSNDAILLVFSDFKFGEISDDYKYPHDYFTKKNYESNKTSNHSRNQT